MFEFERTLGFVLLPLLLLLLLLLLLGPLGTEVVLEVVRAGIKLGTDLASRSRDFLGISKPGEVGK